MNSIEAETNQNLWAEPPYNRPLDVSPEMFREGSPTYNKLLALQQEVDRNQELADLEREEISARNAATLKQLQQAQWDRYYEEYGYPEEPDDSQSQRRMRKIVGVITKTN